MRRILVVEDHPGLRAWVVEELRRATGAMVFSVGDYVQGRVLLAAGPLDLIVTDLYVRSGTAFELVEDVRGHPDHQRTPILLTTKFDPDGLEAFNTFFTRRLARQIRALDVDACLVKPFSPEELEEVAMSLLRRRRRAAFTDN